LSLNSNPEVAVPNAAKPKAKPRRARPGLIPCRIPKDYQAENGAGRSYNGRRHLAAAIDPALGGPELKYIIEISDLETVIKTVLLRIRARDGAKIHREASNILREDTLGWIAATRKHKGSGRGVRRPFVPSIAA